MTKRKRREDKLSQKQKLEDFLKFLKFFQSDDLKQESVIAAAKVYNQHLPNFGAMTSPKVSGRSPDRPVPRNEMSSFVEPGELRIRLSEEPKKQRDLKDELSFVELIPSFKNLIESVVGQSMSPVAMTDESISKALKGFYEVETRYGYTNLRNRLRKFLKELSALDKTENKVKNLITAKIEKVQEEIKNQEKIESNKENLQTRAGRIKVVADMNTFFGHVNHIDHNSKSSNRLQQQHDKLDIGLFELLDNRVRSPEGGKKRKGRILGLSQDESVTPGLG